jgi:hypothetical protein
MFDVGCSMFILSRPTLRRAQVHSRLSSQMYRPFAFERLVHPETNADGRIAHPFRVGVANTIAALIPLSLAAVAYLIGYFPLRGSVAWWAFAAVPSAVAAVALGHAYLGAVIGGKRANNIVILLMVVLIAGLWLLSRHTGSR